MATSSFLPEPDLHPLYPTAAYIEPLLSNSGLSAQQKQALITHSLTRACCFADLSLLTFLLSDSRPRPFVDLDLRDEDGMGLVTLAILGFSGNEIDRDVEREECIRALVKEGADVTVADHSGWTPLHHAALLAPPSLISYLLKNGSSPLAQTRRKLTPLDVISAYDDIPGREDVAIMLNATMRAHGWKGNEKKEEERRKTDLRNMRMQRQSKIRDKVTKVLALDGPWWGDGNLSDSSLEASDLEEDDESDGYTSDTLNTPPSDYNNMLVFSPPTLPRIFQSLIGDTHPSLRDAVPAQAIYLHARFACIVCDHNWLEDLIVGSMDKMEEVVMAKPADLSILVFWLFNSNLLLHLLRCDNDTSQICEILGLFGLMEELINVIYVLIIRVIERRIDTLIDPALLDHTPLSAEFESVQFESEWSFLRTFTSPKKKPPSTSPIPPAISASVKTPNGTPGASSVSRPGTPTRPGSPSTTPLGLLSASNSNTFSTIRNTINRAAKTGTSALLSDGNTTGGPNPSDVVSLLTALHTFMCMFGINPVIIVQTFSQVLYWTSCEMFNRILQRKKYICRSRALQISLNLSVMEEWALSVNLPRGVVSHFQPVRELLVWLQCLSSIDQFANLVATIQTFRHLNPLQMRRAVRDYRYEVSESRMTEECSQYLAQLQKDWERQRVKLGVEALKKEMGEKDVSPSSSILDEGTGGSVDNGSINQSNSAESMAQQGIDNLFARSFEKCDWSPAKPPTVLGELLDSRHMLPLLLPSDPVHLGALPVLPKERNRDSLKPGSRPASRASVGSRGAMEWISRSRKLRVIKKELLSSLGDEVGGVESITAKWKFLWDGAGSNFGHEEGDITIETETADTVQLKVDYPVTQPDGEQASFPAPELTVNPPRVVKNLRRMSSRMDDGLQRG